MLLPDELQHSHVKLERKIIAINHGTDTVNKRTGNSESQGLKLGSQPPSSIFILQVKKVQHFEG